MARGKKKENLTPEEHLQAALVSDREQPYEVPQNWCWTYLGNVSDIVTGGTPSKKKSEYYGTTFPFFKPADLDSGRHVFRAGEYLSDEGKSVSRIIPAYATAVCCIGSIGKSGFLEVSGATNQQINSAIPKFNPLYLYYFCNTNFFVDELWKKSSATTISIVNKSKMESCLFPLAPLSEQQRIVDRIESLFPKLDEAKQKARDALGSFETRKAAILHKAFTGELTAQWRKEHGVGLENWESKPLKNIVAIVKDKFDPTTQSTSLHYIGLEHIQKNQGIIGFGTADDIKSLKTRFKMGDILYGKLRPYLNKHDIAQFDGICSTDILVYRTKHSQTAKYLNYFMNTELFVSTAVSNSKGINLPRVSEKEIGNIAVNIPDISEQTEIVRILDDLLAKEQQAKEVAEAVLEQIDLIKKSILARAFRGELGTNDPAEESAIELLKEVL